MMETEEATQRESRFDVHMTDDIVVCLAVVAVAGPSLIVVPTDWVAVRTLLAFPMLFFLPGYALVSAIYPGRGIRDGSWSPDLATRAAFSLGLSLAILPIVAVAHAISGLDYSLGVLSGSLSAVIVFPLFLAVVRRKRLPKTERFGVPVRRWLRIDAVSGRSSYDAAINGVLVFAVLSAMVIVVGSLLVPISGANYTNFALLTENESGDLVANGYQSEFSPGERGQYVVYVDNHEGKSVEYTIFATVQRIEMVNGSAEVVDQRQLDRFTMTVGPGEKQHRRHTVEPEMSGENLRIAYFLYKDQPANEPTAETAYRKLHVWVSVQGQRQRE